MAIFTHNTQPEDEEDDVAPLPRLSASQYAPDDFVPFVFESEFADEDMPTKDTIQSASYKASSNTCALN